MRRSATGFNREHEQLMLVLAEGHLRWDATSARFDPEHLMPRHRR